MNPAEQAAARKRREDAALAHIAALDDPDRLRAMIANARRAKAPEVARAAFARLCEVQPEAEPGTLEHDVWRAIHALEESLTEERGRTTRLTRTRQKIAKDGEAKTVSDLTLADKPSDGFAMLAEREMLDLSFEAVVLRHPGRFDDTVADAARARLDAAAA